ncbi:MAG: hypothetical protein IPH31_23375 [Lewinellaceae bacterium]|nr:hypothetical protein [Lewinellaceae bacterium]
MSRTTICTLAKQFNSTPVLLKIRTDNYGAETYWEIREDFFERCSNTAATRRLAQWRRCIPTRNHLTDRAATSNMASFAKPPWTGSSKRPLPIHFLTLMAMVCAADLARATTDCNNLDNPGTPLISGGEFEEYSRRLFGAGVVFWSV